MKVAFIGQPEYFRFCYETDLEAEYDVQEFPFTFEMDDQELESLVAFNADVNIFFRGEFFSNTILNRLNGKKIALSSEPFPRYISGKLEYTADSLQRYIDFRSRIRQKSFDHVFHYDDASLAFMAKDGLLLSGHFPFPVATKTYKNYGNEARWDLFFIGRSTQHRETFFGRLKHQHNFLHICHGIFGPPLIEYISSSKICLNVHAEDEVSWEPRLQMLLACGAFVISEPITPNFLLRPGVDYIEAFSQEDMAEKVAYYLKNESQRRQIAASGQARVNELLNANLCFPKLISDVLFNRNPRFTTRPGLAILNGLRFLQKARSRLRSWI